MCVVSCVCLWLSPVTYSVLLVQRMNQYILQPTTRLLFSFAEARKGPKALCCQIPKLVLLGMRETVPWVGTADKVTGRFSAQDAQVSVVVGFGPHGGDPGGL